MQVLLALTSALNYWNSFAQVCILITLVLRLPEIPILYIDGVFLKEIFLYFFFLDRNKDHAIQRRPATAPPTSCLVGFSVQN
jgi:hypothetical protein